MPCFDHRLPGYRRSSRRRRRGAVHRNRELQRAAFHRHAAGGRLGSLPEQRNHRQRNGFQKWTRSVPERRHRDLHGIRLCSDELQRNHRLRRRMHDPRHGAAYLPVERHSIESICRPRPDRRPGITTVIFSHAPRRYIIRNRMDGFRHPAHPRSPHLHFHQSLRGRGNVCVRFAGQLTKAGISGDPG